MTFFSIYAKLYIKSRLFLNFHTIRLIDTHLGGDWTIFGKGLVCTGCEGQSLLSMLLKVEYIPWTS